MAEGSSVRETDGNGSIARSTSERPVQRPQQQQDQQEVPETAGSKRRRDEAPGGTDGADQAGESPDAAVVDADVAPPAAKQARGLYGRVSGLVGRAVNLLTPGRSRRPPPAEAATAAAMEGVGDLEAGRGTAGGEEEPVLPRPGAVPVKGTPAAASSSRTRRSGVVDDDDAADGTNNPMAAAALFSPGVARRGDGGRRPARRPARASAARTNRNGNGAASSSRRASGDGIGSALLRGSTAGDDGAGEEVGLPPVPPFFPADGGGECLSSAAGVGRGAGRGVGSATADRVGGAGAGASPAGLSAVGPQRKKSKGKGRAGEAGSGGANGEPQEEEEEEEEESVDEDAEAGGLAAHTATERRDLFRSRANHRGLSAWEALYLLGHMRDPEATLVKERCVQVYNERIAASAAQDDPALTPGALQQRQQQQQLGRRRRSGGGAVPLFRPSPERKNLPPGADLVPSAPAGPSSPFLMPPPAPRGASGFSAATAAAGGSPGTFGRWGARGGGGGQFGVDGAMPPPPLRGALALRGDDSGDLLTPAKRAQVEAERSGRGR